MAGVSETDYLLTCLAEECIEVAHACMKAIRFGLNDHPPGMPDRPNKLHIEMELDEVRSVLMRLQAKEILSGIDPDRVYKKAEKLDLMIKVSRELDRLI